LVVAHASRRFPPSFVCYLFFLRPVVTQRSILRSLKRSPKTRTALGSSALTGPPSCSPISFLSFECPHPRKIMGVIRSHLQGAGDDRRLSSVVTSTRLLCIPFSYFDSFRLKAQRKITLLGTESASREATHGPRAPAPCCAVKPRPHPDSPSPSFAPRAQCG